ncbi:hypothetical protein TNIN_204181 [Trichonephila inaurata madagascariensis]|uniref:Uncharacterized protein n=1 Tax=Trichonephila inaurata madagascariensis TaxID=2747483 RepID=A0A8X6X4P4_9ARAC|nr:hypothetical protein TNIN_204181 [Trichonephila inaurata madagascariensis]
MAQTLHIGLVKELDESGCQFRCYPRHLIAAQNYRAQHTLADKDLFTTAATCQGSGPILNICMRTTVYYRCAESFWNLRPGQSLCEGAPGQYLCEGAPGQSLCEGAPGQTL